MLKLENINITFNKNTANERKALQHIDLDVADGDFVTVIGSNGAGKSTLMNVISGSYEADTGKIFSGTALGFINQIKAHVQSVMVAHFVSFAFNCSSAIYS